MNKFMLDDEEIEIVDDTFSSHEKDYDMLLCKIDESMVSATDKNLKQAVISFKVSASQGNAVAKVCLGDCYSHGYGVNVDYVEAAKCYKDAADNHGIAKAAHRLAFLYKEGKGVPKNEETAVAYWLIAAQQGISQAQRIISKEYISGTYLKKDLESARLWMEKASKRGDPKAQYKLACYYLSGYGFYNPQKAFEWALKAAEQGYPVAEYLIGGFYLNDIHIHTNYAISHQWFSIASKHGVVEATYELAIDYIEGRGINKNTDLGIKYLIQAADEGHLPASKELADRYFLGIDKYKGETNYTNPTEAHKYALQAVKNTVDGAAQFRLATILHHSFNDFIGARDWYLRSCVNRNVDAFIELSKLYIQQKYNLSEAFKLLQYVIDHEIGDMRRLAEAYYWVAICMFNGYGCEMDKKQAKKFYRMALDNGFIDPNRPKNKLFDIWRRNRVLKVD